MPVCIQAACCLATSVRLYIADSSYLLCGRYSLVSWSRLIRFNEGQTILEWMIDYSFTHLHGNTSVAFLISCFIGGHFIDKQLMRTTAAFSLIIS